MNTRSLVDEQPLRTWAGKGSGACCHMCGRPIKAQEIEYEIELPPEGAGRCLRFHFDCYRAWDTQLKAAADANARLKGQSGNGQHKGAPDPQAKLKAGSAPACAPPQPLRSG